MKTRSRIYNLFARPSSRPFRKAQHRVRLAVEALEDRTVPSTLTAHAVPGAIPVEVRGPQGKLVPLYLPGPVGYTPQQLQTAYGLNQVSFAGIKGDGAGQTIAIVDAYDNPSFVNSTDPNFASSALHIFDQTFGLPDPPSFTKVNEYGQVAPLAPPAPASGNWGLEIALDIEWAHAMAPAASIILVEANNNLNEHIFTAAATAGRLASVVSNSWGGPESSGELSLDSTFQVPGVTFLFSTGDFGAPGEYPAYSPHVVAVGGTSLYNLDAHGDYPGTGTNGEVGWSLGSDSFNPTIAGGGGISQVEPEPSYQNAVQSTGFRTIPDISADADPATGVPVYDPYNFGTADPWGQIGGTSLACPLMAGMVAIADQGRVLSGGQTFSSDQFLADLYRLDQSNPSDFHDIIHGYNGFNAGPGYDLVTGLGTPNGSQLVPDLAYFGLSGRPVLKSIAVTPGNPSVGEGLTEQFTATGTFQGALTQDITTSVAWSSATPAVATIDASGLATAQTFGTSVITASLLGINSPGVTLTSLRLVSLAVAPNDPSVPVLVSVPFTVTGAYSDGSTHDLPSTLVTWASANPAVASIDSKGLATAHALGTSVITASLDGVTSPGDVFTAIAPSFVVNTADDNPYAAGETSLRQAILAANAYPGHTITFDPAVFKKPKTITLTLGDLELSDTTGAETIRGPAAGVTVNGGGRSQVFHVDELVTASISGLTITGGNFAGIGGGLYNSGTTTLTNCTVSGNSAATGGGVANYDFGSLALTNCTVSGNSASIGGGVFNAYYSTATLTNCTVSGNSASNQILGGGGLFNQGAATLTNCTLRSNSASYGGGLYNFLGATAALTNCTVSGNSAAAGGGLWNDYGATATLTNCGVVGNSAHGGTYYGLNFGAGVANVNSQVTLRNCTVSGNSASSVTGGGVANISSPYGFIGSAATATLINCTVSGNSGASGGGVDTAGYVYFNGGKSSATTTLTNCTVSGNSASGNGGGLNNGSFDTTKLTNCTVSDNSASAGGGISNQGTLSVASSNINKNQATSAGGGISTTGGTATITNSAINANQVSSAATALGGGIDCENSLLSLTGCTVNANQASGATALGGGIYAQGSTVNVKNCTVNGNKAKGTVLGEGGGIYSKRSSLTLTASNVHGNKATTDYDDIFNGP